MIGIGVAVHTQSVTAVAVDGAGRTLAERTCRLAASGCAGTCTSSIRRWSCRCADSTVQASSSASAAGSHGASRTCRCRSRASSSRAVARSPERSTRSTRNSNNGRLRSHRPWLRRRHGGKAARRDRPDQPLQERRTTRPAWRCRATRCELRQLNAALYRIASTQSRYHPAARAYLERKTSRRQDTPRSDPLPQTTPRPIRLQLLESEPH